MSHVTILCGTVGRRTSSESTSRNRVQTLCWRGAAGSVFLLFLTDHVDIFILVRVEQEPSDQIGLIVSASLASDHVRMRNPILSPNNSTNWDMTTQALGHTIETRSLQ